MQAKTPKAHLERHLQERLHSQEIQKVLEFLRYELEGVKDQMVRCDPLDFERLQGKAQAYEGLIKTMTRPSLTSIKEPNA